MKENEKQKKAREYTQKHQERLNEGDKDQKK